MVTRHRIPTIFSIYMMDVLCCALGCIVLLWQVSVQDAEDKTLAASTSLSERDLARSQVVQANQVIVSLTGELQSIKASLEDSHKKYLQISIELEKTKQDRAQAAQLALVRKQEYDALKKTYLAAEALVASLKLDLKDQKSKTELTAEQLADKIKANAELLAKIAQAESRIVLLEKDIDAKKLAMLLANTKLDEQTAKLKAADDKALKLDKQLTDLRSLGKEAIDRLKIADLRIKLLEQESDRGKIELADAKRRMQLLTTDQDVMNKRLLSGGKELADARAMIASLEGEKLSLINRAKNIQAQMENRFAGITLTGKKVIFLVDMSGSMDMIDENTLDPDKWPLVCETVGRLMQSLTDLQQYQVILFSDKIHYPLRNNRRWLDYSGPQTAKDTVATLKSIKPTGGTDMYAPMAEAFQYRALGLDTIYLLSDGLPNDGIGLPAGAEKWSEQQKSEVLSKHIRQKLKGDWNRYMAGQPRVRINTIGFFFESPEVGAFLWALAREHDGSFVGMSK